jgi:hypothetical protein
MAISINPSCQCGVTCLCCTERIRRVFVTISGWAEEYHCEGCPDVNNTYELLFNDAGCRWWVLSEMSPCNCNGSPLERQDCNRGIQIALINTCGWNYIAVRAGRQMRRFGLFREDS